MPMNSGTFSLALENPPVPGCTVSGEILPGVFVFSLAEGTDISPESYPVCKLWLAAQGEMFAIAERMSFTPSPEMALISITALFLTSL